MLVPVAAPAFPEVIVAATVDTPVPDPEFTPDHRMSLTGLSFRASDPDAVKVALPLAVTIHVRFARTLTVIVCVAVLPAAKSATVGVVLDVVGETVSSISVPATKPAAFAPLIVKEQVRAFPTAMLLVVQGLFCAASGPVPHATLPRSNPSSSR